MFPDNPVRDKSLEDLLEFLKSEINRKALEKFGVSNAIAATNIDLPWYANRDSESFQLKPLLNIFRRRAQNTGGVDVQITLQLWLDNTDKPQAKEGFVRYLEQSVIETLVEFNESNDQQFIVDNRSIRDSWGSMHPMIEFEFNAQDFQVIESN